MTRILANFRTAADIANALRHLGHGVGSVAIGCAILMGASAPAEAEDYSAKITLHCKDSRYLAAKDMGFENVVAITRNGNAIASATRSISLMRAHGTVRPGGTDGGIEVTAGSQEGTATIVYVLQDFAGRESTVTLDVTVECPQPPPRQRTPTGVNSKDPPPPPPPLVRMSLPHLPGIPTHRLTGCTACQPIVAKLNALIDKITGKWQVAQAEGMKGWLVGPRSAEDDYKTYIRLLAELDDCEKRCPPAQPMTSRSEPPPVVTGRPDATPVPAPPRMATPAPTSPSGLTGLPPSTFPLVGRRTPAQEPAPTPTRAPVSPSGVTGLDPNTFPLIGRFGLPDQHKTQTQGGQTGATRTDSAQHAVEQRTSQSGAGNARDTRQQSGAGDSRSARQPITESTTSSRMPSAPHNAAARVATATHRFTTNAVGAPHVTPRPAGFAATRFTPSAASHFGTIGPARLGGISGFSGAHVGGFSGAHFARR